MTTQEFNIGKALLTAKEVLIQMINKGFGEDKYVFALSNMLCENFKITKEQSIIIIEEALKTI